MQLICFFAYLIAERLALKFFINKKHCIILILFALLLSFAVVIISADRQTVNSEPIDNISENADVSAKGRIYNFLLLGQDEVAGLCDVIIIVSYDTNLHKIEALQIPRDTYASYTTASYRKLNGALHALGGIEKLISFIECSLGISIDYYAKVNIDTIADVVDKLGGIELYIPMDMFYDDPYQNLTINLEKGSHHLDGNRAVQFLRYRAGYVRGDIGRLDAQKIFLAALIDKVLNDMSVSDMISIALSLISKIETNISAAECIFFISQIDSIKSENIALMTMPGEDIKSQSGAWYYIINRDEAYKIIKKYFSPSINENDFDKDRLFTSIYRDGFNRIYEAKNTYKTKRYTANEICRDGINID